MAILTKYEKVDSNNIRKWTKYDLSNKQDLQDLQTDYQQIKSLPASRIEILNAEFNLFGSTQDFVDHFQAKEDEVAYLLGLFNDATTEENIDLAINFFQKISSKYEIEVFVSCLSSFFLEEFHNLNSRLISIFFIEIFCLKAPEFDGTEEDQRNYVILPALTLAKLKDKGFDIDKIFGGFLQLDHEGDMSYQISQIIDYLLENNFIGMYDLINIIKNILMNEYASYVRVGRLLGILIEFNILKVKLVVDIIQTIRIDLGLVINIYLQTILCEE